MKSAASRAACVKVVFPELFFPTKNVTPDSPRSGHSANLLKFLKPILFIL